MREAPDNQSVALVFESGVVRFDADGTLFVHLTHGSAAPHPLVLHEVEGASCIPGDTSEAHLEGIASGAGWQAAAALPETDVLPEGFVFRFRSWDLAKVEMSGDLSVALSGVGSLPTWMRAGHVHRFDGPDGGVSIWRGSAPPPALEAVAEAPWSPEQTGRWVGGSQTARPAGCSAMVALFALGLAGLRMLAG